MTWREVLEGAASSIGARLARLHDGMAGRLAARVLLAAATALLMFALAPAGAASASEPATSASLANPAIVGGGQIPVTLAPWQVEVEEVIPVAGGEPMVFICGGSILAPRRSSRQPTACSTNPSRYRRRTSLSPPEQHRTSKRQNLKPNRSKSPRFECTRIRAESGRHRRYSRRCRGCSNSNRRSSPGSR